MATTFALNRELFHSCRIDEVVGALAAITARHPAARTFVVGHSLGGNFALRAAARAPGCGYPAYEGRRAYAPCCGPRARCARSKRACGCTDTISCAVGAAVCSPKPACFPELYDFGDLRRFPTLTATTEFFATRYASFPDLDAYLNGYAITGDALARLTVPAHLIAAADDPVIPIDDLQRSRRSRRR